MFIIFFILKTPRSQADLSGRGLMALLASVQIKSWAAAGRQRAQLAFCCSFLWWEGPLPHQIRGHEDEVGRTASFFMTVARRGWGKQQPFLDCLAEIILLDVHVNQWVVEKLGARHIHSYREQESSDEGREYQTDFFRLRLMWSSYTLCILYVQYISISCIIILCT